MEDKFDAFKAFYETVFIAPHADDEALFGTYIIQKYKPLIVLCTDDNVHEMHVAHWLTRRSESRNAAKRLGVNLVSLGILETQLDIITAPMYLERIKLMGTIRTPLVIAPEFPNFHPHHQLIGEYVYKNCKNVLFYPTLNANNKIEPIGEIVETFEPTPEQRAFKEKLLRECYWWQNAHHRPMLDAAIKSNEYLTKL
jgi:LmbE family N-acetylglucosaminyl deacetylase